MGLSLRNLARPFEKKTLQEGWKHPWKGTQTALGVSMGPGFALGTTVRDAALQKAFAKGAKGWSSEADFVAYFDNADALGHYRQKQSQEAVIESNATDSEIGAVKNVGYGAAVLTAAVLIYLWWKKRKRK